MPLSVCLTYLKLINMWKLINIYAENLCAFRELDYMPLQGITTLVFGNNLDNDSQKSNGSGKSALIETIAIGISGSPLRKIKNEEIINDMSDECFVKLTFDNDSCTERFIVERKLSRKSASSVKCSIVRDGKLVETDEAVRSSVSEYDKYILEKLGITKDELYNNFILSKHKFQDFLSCSDKDKKEIINRFSNGVIVDKAIEKLSEDMAPIQSDLSQAALTVANFDGRIEMLNEQIQAEANSQEEKAKSKLQKIQEKEEAITLKRSEIREYSNKIEEVNTSLDQLEIIDAEVLKTEEDEDNAKTVIKKISTLFAGHITGLSDWGKRIEEKENQIPALEKELGQITSGIKTIQEEIKSLETENDVLRKKHKEFEAKYPGQIKRYEENILSQQKEIASLEEAIHQISKTKRNLNTAIEEIKTKLAGTIACPKCSHKFLLSDNKFDVDKAGETLEKNQKEVVRLNLEVNTKTAKISEYEALISVNKTEKNRLMSDNNNWLDKLNEAQGKISRAMSKINDLNLKQQRVSGEIALAQNELESIRKKIFDEAYNLLDDAFSSKERLIKQLEGNIEAAKGSIETLQSTIKEIKESSETEIIETLKASLKEFTKKSSEAILEKSKIEIKLNTLKEQEQRFIEFKTYLANTKIEALSKITNEFLESIGSDIRIKFSGYTILKSGKLRDKISISIIRDGIDCGSFGKFSEGEKARVNLANILAMHKLININCGDNKGLDLLVLDEILEAVDENGLANMFSALNNIGTTAIVVSHGNVAENYPYKLIINKQNGESYINAN